MLSDLEKALREFVAGALTRADVGPADEAAMQRIRSLADSAVRQERAAWVDYLGRIQASDPVPQRQLDKLATAIDRFLVMSKETATLGSMQVPIIRFQDARTRIAEDGEALLATTLAACVNAAADREEKNRAWQNRRLRFIEELHTREETRDIMIAYARAEAMTGPRFDVEYGGLPFNLSIRAAFIHLLRAVLNHATDSGQPFTFLYLPVDEVSPLHDFRTMLAEWIAGRSKEKSVA